MGHWTWLSSRCLLFSGLDVGIYPTLARPLLLSSCGLSLDGPRLLLGDCGRTKFRFLNLQITILSLTQSEFQSMSVHWSFVWMVTPHWENLFLWVAFKYIGEVTNHLKQWDEISIKALFTPFFERERMLACSPIFQLGHLAENIWEFCC